MLKSKKAKIALFSGLGVAAVALVGGALLYSGVMGGSTVGDETMPTSLSYQVVQEGSIASSTLLTGVVSAAEEQYVYYDPSKGDISEILVEPGSQVEAGTALLRYDSTELQSALDSAVRARDKVGRQIDELQRNYQTVTVPADATTGEETQSTSQQSYDSQLADLNDAYADAQAAVDKAYIAVLEATVTSTVSGTVVEVNKSVSKNATGSQTVIHIVNQASLQVKGNLTEYDLANIATDQAVKLTTKVYPDQTWDGKISYISNYPATDQEASAVAGATSGTGAKYPFKVAITSEVGDLKQGFTVNIEVVNTSKNILVPVTAVVYEEDKTFVWTIVDGKAKKVEVTLGNADAINQEVQTGLAVGDHVISYPTLDLEDGKEVEAYEEPAKLTNIIKSYRNGDQELRVLKDIDLEVEEGEFLAIMGPSGSGKSTLMNIIGLLDRSSSGNYWLEGEEVSQLSEKKLASVRNDQIGFVFQQFFLLSKLNALQNVELPLIYAGVPSAKRKKLAKQYLEKVELAERMTHLPSELSGGQKQRVAIARALVNTPAIILADEPTGALDTKTGQQIMELLIELNNEGKTIIMVTHEPEIAAYAKRTIVLRDGVITEDRRREEI